MIENKTTSSSEAKGASRRGFLLGSMAMAGGVTLTMTRSLNAQTTGTTGTVPASDIALLNFALRLENLEAFFYNQGLAKFSASDFANADFFSALPTNIGGKLYQYLQLIRDHENTHVATLVKVITSLGGTPMPAECYNFGYTTPSEFLQIAKALENTGVMAYDGAAGLVQTPALLTAAATIATVEARHASYLNLVNRENPFPAAFDTPKTMAEILAIAGQFIGVAGCVTPTPTSTNVTKAVANPKMLTTGNNTVQLDGSTSTALNGGSLNYLWEIELGSNYATFDSPTKKNPIATLKGGPGYYIFQLQVTDSAGNNSTDTTVVNYTGA
jgi:hypothetical protein